MKIPGGAECGVIADNGEVVRAVGQPDFRGNFRDAGWQMDHAGSRERQRDQQSEDQALFY